MLEKIIIYVFGFLFLSILFILRVYIIGRKSAISSYTLSKKKISWKTVGKYWVCLQAFSFFLLKDKIDIFLFPILFIGLLIVHAICGSPEIKPNSNEYKEYEKSFKRDKKINKVLK